MKDQYKFPASTLKSINEESSECNNSAQNSCKSAFLRKFKKGSLFSYIFFLTFSLTFFTSCEEDDTDGLFGDPVDRFVGLWKCEENGDLNGFFGPFDVEIVRNPGNSSEVFIRNFNYQGMNEKALAIIAGNTITIPRQRICDDTIEIQGSGSLRNNQISMTYRTNDGADLENITARFFKP